MITQLLTPALKINSGNPIDKIFYHLPIFLPIQQINNTKVTQKSKIKDKTNFDTEDFQTTLGNEDQMDYSDTRSC